MDVLAAHLLDEDAALDYLARQRWPSGVRCPSCPGAQNVYELKSKPGSEHALPAGVFKCAGCRRKFNVRTGTIFENSHVPVYKWLRTIDLICGTAVGSVRALPLQRTLELKSYRSAWFMLKRIRWALRQAEASSSAIARVRRALRPRDTDSTVGVILGVMPTSEMPRPSAHREKSAVAHNDDMYGKLMKEDNFR